MRILHYSLGFPPYRRGGLTKYCLDLMKVQAKDNSVGMIWAGDIGIYKPQKIAIKKHRNFSVDGVSIENFEIKGLLPIPLLEGIREPEFFMEYRASEAWESFLKQYKPDVIHFHTLMGFPKEYIECAKRNGIFTIFTTHDYFGLCPRTTLVRTDGSICDGCSLEYCNYCNRDAMDEKKLAVLQSTVYRKIKNNFLIKQLRKFHFESQNAIKNFSEPDMQKYEGTRYYELREYYKEMINSFDLIIFNSQNTKLIYDSIVKTKNNIVVPVTHSLIRKHTASVKKEVGVIRFSYLGPNTYHKGYFLLKEALNRLTELGYKFILNVYFEDTSQKYIVSHDSYKYEDLSIVMSEADIVVVPSLWNETYGFIVPEALSCGVPVLVSSRVGSKDEIQEGMGFVVEPTLESLTEYLLKILKEPNVLQTMKNIIIKNYIPQTISSHEKTIMKLYTAR